MQEINWLNPVEAAVETEAGWENMERGAEGWTRGDICVTLSDEKLAVRLAAAKTPVKTVLLRWKTRLLPGRGFLATRGSARTAICAGRACAMAAPCRGMSS